MSALLGYGFLSLILVCILVAVVSVMTWQYKVADKNIKRLREQE
jgi:hypothetical protein